MALPNEIHPFAIAGGGNQYQVANSLRFRASNSASLTRTPGSAGNRQKFTFSTWLKRGTLSLNQGIFSASSGADQNNEFLLFFGSGNGDTISVQQTVGGTSAGQISTISNAVFRDPSAWYHIVLAIDTTQATSTNRLFLYVNGVSQTFSTYSVGSSINTWVNNTNGHSISKRADASLYFDGYQTEIYLIDGQQLDPTYFGQTDSITGIWGPKKYTGTYGTNGFYLPFNDATSTTTIGYDRQLGMSDSSKNNWTLNNFTVNSPANTAAYLHDSYIDVPTNWNDGSTNRANYATLNPLSNLNTTLNSGNLYQYYAGSWSSALATIGVTSGKWYMEAYQVAVVATSYTIVGVAYQPWTTSTYLGGSATSYGFQWGGATSYKYFNNNGGVAVSTPSGTLSVGGILQLAFDADTGNVWYGLNNTWAEGNPSAGTGASHTVSPTPGIGSVWFMGIGQYGGNASAVNFGQRPFSYTPPAGFKALNSYNLANPSLPLV